MGLAEIIYLHTWYNVDNEDEKYWVTAIEVGRNRMQTVSVLSRPVRGNFSPQNSPPPPIIPASEHKKGRAVCTFPFTALHFLPKPRSLDKTQQAVYPRRGITRAGPTSLQY
jgi:hypothetical protein